MTYGLKYHVTSYFLLQHSEITIAFSLADIL